MATCDMVAIKALQGDTPFFPVGLTNVTWNVPSATLEDVHLPRRRVGREGCGPLRGRSLATLCR